VRGQVVISCVECFCLSSAIAKRKQVQRANNLREIPECRIAVGIEGDVVPGVGVAARIAHPNVVVAQEQQVGCGKLKKLISVLN
jgi:hypothetical protein